jgi:hypothetical protein
VSAAVRGPSPRAWEIVVFFASFAVCGLAVFALVFTSPTAYAEFAVRERVDLNAMRAPGWPDPAFGGGIEITWYSPGILADLHRHTFEYLLGAADAVPASPTRGDFYSPTEAAHLQEARDTLTVGRALVLACAIALAALCVRARLRRGLGRLVRLGGTAAGVVGAMLAVGVLVFEPAVAGHQNLTALYPETFLREAALRSTMSLIALCAVLAIIGQLTDRMASHGASAGAPHPDLTLARPRLGARR